MSSNIVCECGRTYSWKPTLAGKRARCKCGATLQFEFEPNAAVEQTDLQSHAAEAPPFPAPIHAAPTPTANSALPSIWIRLGILAGGLALLGYFAVWPMMQVLRGAVSINITFKGIILASMLTMVGLNLVLLGEKGIPWKRDQSQPLSSLQKISIAVTAIAALVVVGLVWLFFNQHGYEIKF